MLFDFSEEPKQRGCPRGDKAEARRAASAQEFSPISPCPREAGAKRRRDRAY